MPRTPADTVIGDGCIDGSISSSDVIHLNVGGCTKVAVLRRTLTSFDSMLATRFSGRWDDSIEKDRDGNFFIDQPPELFVPLLNYLRAKMVETPRAPPVVSPLFHVAEEEKGFFRIVEYYGLTSTVYPCVPQVTTMYMPVTFNPSKACTINENSVSAIKMSPVRLQPIGHCRRIISYEVRLGKNILGKNNFRIGWQTDDCRRVTALEWSYCYNSLSVWTGQTNTSGSTLPLPDNVVLQEGSVIRCCTPCDESAVPDWWVDGNKIRIIMPDDPHSSDSSDEDPPLTRRTRQVAGEGNHSTHKFESHFDIFCQWETEPCPPVPYIIGKGEWDILDIQLDFRTQLQGR